MMKKSVSGNFKRNIFFCAAGAVLMGTALYQLTGIGMESKERKDFYGRIEKSAVEESSSEEKTKEEVTIDFDTLKKMNEDIVGWILFDKNGISYPILQGKDNEEYLYTMADGTKNPAGSIFLDALCSPDFEDAHTIIYGHNMKDLSMFGKLKQYGIKKDYYQENKYFTIYTPDGAFRYEIFAWYEAAEDDSVYQVGSWEEESFGEFVAQMIKRRYRDTEVTAGKNDKIVTLSTCSSAGMRFVVHGKRVERD